MANKARPFCRLLASLLVLAGPLGHAVAETGQDCSAEVTAELQDRRETDRGVRLEFSIELVSPEECAGATYDLILVELLPNGQWKSIRKTSHVDIVSGKANDVVEHVMAADLKLLEYEARVVDCTRCKGP
jgi:hypothetical protein